MSDIPLVLRKQTIGALMNDLEKLATLLSETNSIRNKISEITELLVTIGHTGNILTTRPSILSWRNRLLKKE